ncbi:cyclin-dependent kinase inhibitor 1C [Pelodytes ibericus]
MCNVQGAELAQDRLVARRTFPCQQRTRVCRSLFGPVDHEELDRELRVTLREMEQESCQKWGFDFQRGSPLPGTRFIWEEIQAHSVPAFYRDQVPQGLEGHIHCLKTNGGSQKPTLTVSTGSCKRPLNTGQITDYFPVRKKTRDRQALCDKMCVDSANPAEQTPRNPLK